MHPAQNCDCDDQGAGSHLHDEAVAVAALFGPLLGFPQPADYADFIPDMIPPLGRVLQTLMTAQKYNEVWLSIE